MENVRERARERVYRWGEAARTRYPLTRGVRGGFIPRKIFLLEIIVAAAAGLLTERSRVCAEKTHPGEPAALRGGGNGDNFWSRRRRVVCFIEPAVARAKCFRSLLMFVNP